MRDGDAVEAEEDALWEFLCLFLFCKGLFAKPSCVVRVHQGFCCISVSFGVLFVNVCGRVCVRMVRACYVLYSVWFNEIHIELLKKSLGAGPDIGVAGDTEHGEREEGAR